MTVNESDGKVCADCKEWKTFDNFYKKKGRKDPYLSYCKECVKIRNKNNYHKNNEQRRAWQRTHNAKLKEQVYDYYGSICNCCGETNVLFLTIDHVNNDGAEHRRSLSGGENKNGSGMQLYYAIVNDGFSDRYQILCYNCNMGKARNNGRCPHEVEGIQ